MNYSNEFIEKMLKEMVLESISSVYDIQSKDAALLIDNSSFLELLKEDPEFIGHYPPEYWAGYIIDEKNNMTHN